MISYVNAIHKEVKELNKSVKELIKVVEKVIEQEKKWQLHESEALRNLQYEVMDDGK